MRAHRGQIIRGWRRSCGRVRSCSPRVCVCVIIYDVGIQMMLQGVLRGVRAISYWNKQSIAKEGKRWVQSTDIAGGGRRGVELSSRIVEDREEIAFVCGTRTKERSRQYLSRRTQMSGKQGR